MILCQTVQDIELIISDDHSTDDTPLVAAELVARDRRVRYHRPAIKGGVSLVLNEGVQKSRGHYIQICHDHDIYLPTLLEKLVTILENNPTVVFAHPGIQWCDHLGNPLPQARFVMGFPEVSDGFAWRRTMLRRLASPVCALSMIRRTALEETGLFDPDFGITTDVEMWLRLCAIGDVGYANELLILVRGREPDHPYAGVNWQLRDEVVRAHRKHLKLTYHGWQYAWRKIGKEFEIDRSHLISFLSSKKRHRMEELQPGRIYLRHHGVFLSRIAGWVL